MEMMAVCGVQQQQLCIWASSTLLYKSRVLWVLFIQWYTISVHVNTRYAFHCTDTHVHVHEKYHRKTPQSIVAQQIN